MPRLLVNNEFLEPVAGTSYFEADFENQVWGQREVLFSGWHVARFKASVTARGEDRGPRRPDLALVHAGYREWWVVEVELASHDLQNHVLPQIDTFVLGEYTADHAACLTSQVASLDAARVHALVAAAQPGVLVIVNEDAAGWAPILEARGARLCVVQPFRSRLGRYGYYISGFLPTANSTLVTGCRRSGWWPRALEVSNPAALDLTHGLSVPVRCDSGTSYWTYLITADASYLTPSGPGDPLPASVRDFDLHRAEDGLLEIEPRRRTLSRRM